MPVLPIILVSDGVDIGMYGSTEELFIDVETIDVANGVHVAYGADGTLLSLTAEGGWVRLGQAEDKPLHAESLAEILRRYLITIGMPRPLAHSYSLPELMSTSAPHLMQDVRSRPFPCNLWQLARRVFSSRTTKKWKLGKPNTGS